MPSPLGDSQEKRNNFGIFEEEEEFNLKDILEGNIFGDIQNTKQLNFYRINPAMGASLIDRINPTNGRPITAPLGGPRKGKVENSVTFPIHIKTFDPMDVFNPIKSVNYGSASYEKYKFIDGSTSGRLGGGSKPQK